MFLGIEIGGTKTQLGVGTGADAHLAALERFDVDPVRGAAGILQQIQSAAPRLIAVHGVRGIGIGFGGPVDAAQGRAVKSHHIRGWDQFPLVDWCRRELGLPAVVGNDADLAGLAEAHFGAGRGRNPVFYITVGTGIGGGLIVGGEIYSGNGHGAAELGHLRPGLDAKGSQQTLESLAAGWGIAAQTQRAVAEALAFDSQDRSAADLLCRAGTIEAIQARQVAAAAGEGNALAVAVLHSATQALGWGVAQMITLLAPQAVVIGGGVSLMGEKLFLAPVRTAVDQYVFPPLRGTFQIVPAQLGEEMVLYGALKLALVLTSASR